MSDCSFLEYNYNLLLCKLWFPMIQSHCNIINWQHNTRYDSPSQQTFKHYRFICIVNIYSGTMEICWISQPYLYICSDLLTWYIRAQLKSKHSLSTPDLHCFLFSKQKFLDNILIFSHKSPATLKYGTLYLRNIQGPGQNIRWHISHKWNTLSIWDKWKFHSCKLRINKSYKYVF